MKNLVKNLNSFYLFGLLFFSLTLVSCSDDDDEIDEFVTEATIIAENQMISQNTLVISEVTVDEDAWLVVKKVKEDGTFTNPIAEPLHIEEGTHTDIEIPLQSDEVSLESGDTLVIQVHRADDDDIFDFEDDEPFLDEFGGTVFETVQITAPGFEVTDQTVTDNSVTFDSVTTVNDGFIVIHTATEDGVIDETNIVGYTFVPAGGAEDVVVTFEEGFTPVAGDELFARLYMDDPADQEFTFEADPATDNPVIFGFDEDDTLTDSFLIE